MGENVVGSLKLTKVQKVLSCLVLFWIHWITNTGVLSAVFKQVTWLDDSIYRFFKRLLKVSTLGAFTTDSGSSFHSDIDLGKNEFLYTIFEDSGSWKLLLLRFWCLLMMFSVTQSENCLALILLFDFIGIRYSLLFIAGTLPFCIL